MNLRDLKNFLGLKDDDEINVRHMVANKEGVEVTLQKGDPHQTERGQYPSVRGG